MKDTQGQGAQAEQVVAEGGEQATPAETTEGTAEEKPAAE